MADKSKLLFLKVFQGVKFQGAKSDRRSPRSRALLAALTLLAYTDILPSQASPLQSAPTDLSSPAQVAPSSIDPPQTSPDTQVAKVLRLGTDGPQSLHRSASPSHAALSEASYISSLAGQLTLAQDLEGGDRTLTPAEPAFLPKTTSIDNPTLPTPSAPTPSAPTPSAVIAPATVDRIPLVPSQPLQLSRGIPNNIIAPHQAVHLASSAVNTPQQSNLVGNIPANLQAVSLTTAPQSLVAQAIGQSPATPMPPTAGSYALPNPILPSVNPGLPTGYALPTNVPSYPYGQMGYGQMGYGQMGYGQPAGYGQMGYAQPMGYGYFAPYPVYPAAPTLYPQTPYPQTPYPQTPYSQPIGIPTVNRLPVPAAPIPSGVASSLPSGYAYPVAPMGGPATPIAPNTIAPNLAQVPMGYPYGAAPGGYAAPTYGAPTYGAPAAPPNPYGYPVGAYPAGMSPQMGMSPQYPQAGQYPQYPQMVPGAYPGAYPGVYPGAYPTVGYGYPAMANPYLMQSAPGVPMAPPTAGMMAAPAYPVIPQMGYVQPMPSIGIIPPLTAPVNVQQVNPGIYGAPALAQQGTITNQPLRAPVDREGVLLEPGSAQKLQTANRPLFRSTAITQPKLTLQGTYLYQASESSARARLQGIYPLSSRVLFGASLDLSTGNAFTDTPNDGFNVNELYLATSLPEIPNLRFSVGQLDLTSYFDRNSFAKDGATHFFNSIFQTNPALSAVGLSSRPGLLVNWNLTDNIEAKAAAFSSARGLGDFSFDGFAGELGLRYGNTIIRGTYATGRESGSKDGPTGIFELPRGNGQSGVIRGDREEAYGVNAEIFFPGSKMGAFARYGRYNNLDLGEGGDTFSGGVSWLDVFSPDDRLGVAYGRGLSNERLRARADERKPDALEVFYDFRFMPNLRLGFSLQGRNDFSDIVAGVRLKTEFDITPKGLTNQP